MSQPSPGYNAADQLAPLKEPIWALKFDRLAQLTSARSLRQCPHGSSKTTYNTSLQQAPSASDKPRQVKGHHRRSEATINGQRPPSTVRGHHQRSEATINPKLARAHSSTCSFLHPSTPYPYPSAEPACLCPPNLLWLFLAYPFFMPILSLIMHVPPYVSSLLFASTPLVCHCPVSWCPPDCAYPCFFS